MPTEKRSSVLAEIYATEVKKRGFTPDRAQLQALAPLERLRSELAAAADASIGSRLIKKLRTGGKAEPIRGVYLWGGVGRGKTWLMDLFYNSIVDAGKRRSHFYRFMQATHAELGKLKRQQAPLALVADRIAAGARVLCFDELFVTDIADAMLLGGLFQALLDRNVALVFTSNVAPKDLYRGGLQRQRFLPTIALLERHTDVVHVDGKVDYRLRHLADAKLYLDSADPGAEAALAAVFDQLSDGDTESLGYIAIETRKIPVRRESENVVWFDFAALCEGPRAAADYIHIAREYQSVLVSDVPLFDATRDDAARRFVSLVDEFYDRGVNLIVSAAAAPQALYRGERLRLEFERTTSRLIEMQSRDYLAREHTLA